MADERTFEELVAVAREHDLAVGLRSDDGEWGTFVYMGLTDVEDDPEQVMLQITDEDTALTIFFTKDDLRGLVERMDA